MRNLKAVRRKAKKSKGKAEEYDVATCPHCGEPLAILPTEAVNLRCQNTDKIIRPQDVVWTPRSDIVEIALSGEPQPVCKYCGGLMRSVGAPLCKHLCNGQYWEGSDILWVPPSHIPANPCGGPDTSSGDSFGSFLGNVPDGPQLEDDQLAPSKD